MTNSYLHQLGDLEEKEILPGFYGKFVHGEKTTMAYWRIEEGSTLIEHSHHHEQVVNMLSGRFELIVDGEHFILEEGMVLTIPSHMPHSGRAITDCRILDVFSPPREEYR